MVQLDSLNSTADVATLAYPAGGEDNGVVTSLRRIKTANATGIREIKARLRNIRL
jgi:hypothetical protein